MAKKWIFLFAAGLAAAALMAAGAYLRRPVMVNDQGQVSTVQALALTAGQALHAAGIQLGPLDEVSPGLESPLPWRREVRIRRAVQAYLWQDGALLDISGFDQTPAALLTRAGVDLAPQDELRWNGQPLAPDTPLPAGRPVVLLLRRAQSLTVVIDEQPSQVASTGPAVIDVLWQAGVQLEPGDWLSVDPGSPVDEAGTVGYRAASPVTIRYGEQEVTFHTAAETVGQALAEAGITPQHLDFSQPAEDQPIPPDHTIRVVQVREEVTLQKTLTPFESQSAPDPEVELDQRRVTTPGQYGVQVARERVRYEDGQEVSRVVDAEWTASQPVTQVVGYGTKIVPKTLDTPGGPVEYYRAVQVYTTSYSPCRLGTGRCNYTTASGARLTKGSIAVTRAWYRLFAGSRLYVPGYGFGVITDVGGGIPGRYWIDLGFDEDNYQNMTGWTTVYFLTPAPANVPWVLP